MKKRLLPIDYNYTFSGAIGGIVCILGVFIILIVGMYTPHPIEISEWAKAAVPISAVGILIGATDLKGIKKTRELRRQRDIMLKKESVPGEIVDIKRHRMDWRGRFSEGSNSKARYAYQMKVSYCDPTDGKQKTALSEYYSENLFACLSGKQVEVYVYGDNGYVVVDGLRIRKFGEKKIDLGNYENPELLSDISFYVDIYGRWIIPICTVIAMAILIAFLKIFQGSLKG